MLRAGTTCTDAINFLDNDLAAGLNDVSLQLPHRMETGANAEADIRAVRREYDRWTWKAAEELNRRFSDREIAGQLRAGRYRAILTAPPSSRCMPAGPTSDRGRHHGGTHRDRPQNPGRRPQTDHYLRLLEAQRDASQGRRPDLSPPGRTAGGLA
ncbi:hypothetical protein [Streptomyces sp. NPDC097610]|uniref:hypothetical protein n=1 Tax=Streptomyces sp. NPDC097610 TaxID=3157227 RepID=UPI003322567B